MTTLRNLQQRLQYFLATKTPIRSSLIVIILYSIAYFPLLLQRGAFWDGWTFYTQFIFQDFAWEYSILAPWRNYHHYYTYLFLNQFPDPVFAAKAIVFFSWLISGLILLKILRRIVGWSESAAVICVLYYLLYPTFIVRFEFINVYYSFATLIFTIACYAYLSAISGNHRWTLIREIFSLTLFGLAFLVNSFLFFFFGFLTVHFVLFAKTIHEHNISTLAGLWIRRYWYLFIFPIAFLVVKTVVFPPYGPGIDYNRLLIFDGTVHAYATIFGGLWAGLWAGFLWPMVGALQFLERKFFAALFLLSTSITFFILFKCTTFEKESMPAPNIDFFKSINRWSPDILLLLAGCAFLFLGLFPYTAVGKYPHLYGYGFGLRHSLLMPLGCAFVLFSSIRLCINQNIQKYVHATMLSLSITFLWYNYFLLDMDWYKQQAIVVQLPAVMRTIEPPATFVFRDETTGYNWLGRNGARQDYNGFLELVSGHRLYHGLSEIDYKRAPLPEELAVSSTHFVRITSRRNWDDPIFTEWLRLKWIEIIYGESALRTAASQTLQIALKEEEYF